MEIEITPFSINVYDIESHKETLTVNSKTTLNTLIKSLNVLTGSVNYFITKKHEIFRIEENSEKTLNELKIIANDNLHISTHFSAGNSYF